MRSFNISGPCLSAKHYMLPPDGRLGRVLKFIAQEKFLTLYAGRQTGKTTSLLWLERHLNSEGKVRALWVDVQTAREKPSVAQVMPILLQQLDLAIRDAAPEFPRPTPAEVQTMLQIPDTALVAYLRQVASVDSVPLVVFFDEADSLVGAAMVSFLTQLRQGYIGRSKNPFPSSVVLAGQREVRDYALTEEDRRAVSWLGTASPFNVSAEATTLVPFEENEVATLLHQHTAETGQRFEPDAVKLIWDLGQGHPWLTNAMADQIVTWDVTDRLVPITAAHVEAAKETIILQRRTHIDSLIHKLRDPRVQRIIEPMLLGNHITTDTLDDDFAYVLGLGLLRSLGGKYEIANPIYKEVIPRALSFSHQMQIPHEPAGYVRSDGSLHMEKLMADWQTFWREDGHIAAAGFSYQEAGPHLMLMAFLQRIVNGGGRIVREYSLGRGALDLLIFWKGERHAIEVKLRRDEDTEERALNQLGRYLNHLGLNVGWLVLFDLRKTLSWKEKLTLRDVEHLGKTIRIVGC